MAAQRWDEIVRRLDDAGVEYAGRHPVRPQATADPSGNGRIPYAGKDTS